MNFTHFSTQDILQIKLPQKIPQVNNYPSMERHNLRKN